jgi:hypothetical protein
MDFKIEDFFPLYPENDKKKFPKGSLNVINMLKEFTDNRLDTIEILPTEPGEATKHQVVIKRLLSGYTQFDALLLVHEMGTGKTCSAIQAIEQNFIDARNGLFNNVLENDSMYLNENTLRVIGPGLNGAIILTRGKTLMNNFMDELVNRCTKIYSSSGNKKLKMRNIRDDNEISKASKKLFSKFYSFYTFEIFAKTVKKMTPSEIVSKFDNKIIVIDESHNLRPKQDQTLIDQKKMKDVEKLDIYIEIHRFLHTLKNKKVLLLTGTPMKDGPQEIASLMNLILPLTRQMPTHKNFLKEYFPPNQLKKNFDELGDEEEFLKNGGEDMKHTEKFKKQIYGCVSFLKAMDSTVKKVMVGEKIGTLKHYNVVPKYMSDFQTQIYSEAYIQDKNEKGIYNNSRQASRFVFQDGTYGSEGFKNNIIENSGKHFRLGPALKRAITEKSIFINDSSLTDEQRELIYLENIRRMSVEYAYILKSILDATRNGELSIVYNDAVRGSGLIVLTLLLEMFGFVKNNGSTKIKKSYGIFSNETTSVKEIRMLQKIFNSDNNMNGAIMPVIFGSRVIAEGLTFKNVIHEHVVPHWNGSETEQVIARGWRLGSHEALLNKWQEGGKKGKKPQLNVYRHVVIPSLNMSSLNMSSLNMSSSNRGSIKSIDLIMYEVSEKKDIAISKVLRCLKEVAIDCQLFKKRNEKDASFDNQRECEYEKCNYVCDDSGPISNTASINYQTIYFREDALLMFKMLETHYKTRFVSTLDEIIEMYKFFPKHSVTDTEVIQLLYEIVSNNIPIKNVYGYPCYLYENHNVFFLVDHTLPFPSADDIFLAYYSKHPQLYVKTDFPNVPGSKYFQNVTWFNIVLNDYFESLIPLALRELNDLDTPSSNIDDISKKLISLPNDVQQRIIEVAVSAKILERYCKVNNSLPPLPLQLSKEWNERGQKNIFCNKNRFRTIILDHYKNYYRIDDIDSFKMAIVWFLSDIVEERAKERCLYGSSLTGVKIGRPEQSGKNKFTGIERPLWNEWKTCSKKERERVEIEKSLIWKKYETPLGYYGLWNPKLNEFCIRDITQNISTNNKEITKKDKRSVPSGKRCINWTKPALTQLATIAIDIPIPAGAVLPTIEDAIEEVKENRYLLDLIPNKNLNNAGNGGKLDDLIIRLAFWYKLSRSNICVHLREWFEKNNLLVEDNSCGVQTKRK